MSPVNDGTHLLITHRSPGPLWGLQHVSMFSASLGQLYDDVRNHNKKSLELSIEDMLKAARLCMISADVYEGRRIEARSFGRF